MASNSESSPLLSSSRKPGPPAPVKRQRTVTFNPTLSTNAPAPAWSSEEAVTAEPLAHTQSESSGSQPILSALSSKIKRRHSHGSPVPTPILAQAKAGAQRTTKTAQKLKLLPDADHDDEEESGRDVYSQFTRIKDPTARRDAARLGKKDRQRLPRVTAYCTANAYRLDEVMKFLRSRMKSRGTAPKQFDECIYTPFSYSRFGEAEPETHLSTTSRTRRFSDSDVDLEHNSEQRIERYMDMHTSAGDTALENGEENISNHTTSEMQQTDEYNMEISDIDTQVHTPEVFLFNYGTVVIWGMTVKEEERFLKEIAKFETEKLSKDDIQAENFNFYYTQEYQARIYNDFISLREKRNYMAKLAISHALSQSVKTSLYEDLVDNTIEITKDVPAQIALTGKVNLSRKEINMQIGELFILRINIHLQGSVLDSPELMWAEPQLDPVYQAVRSYLEMDQRVSLLTERLEVIADLLAVLKDQLTSTHGEVLEWIVIVLIALEILVAAINIVVDLYAGVD